MKFLKELNENNTIAHYDAEQYPENQHWNRHDDPRARATDMINQAVEDNQDSFEMISDVESLIDYLRGKHHDFSPQIEQMVRDIISEELGGDEYEEQEETPKEPEKNAYLAGRRDAKRGKVDPSKHGKYAAFYRAGVSEVRAEQEQDSRKQKHGTSRVRITTYPPVDKNPAHEGDEYEEQEERSARKKRRGDSWGVDSWGVDPWAGASLNAPSRRIKDKRAERIYDKQLRKHRTITRFDYEEDEEVGHISGDRGMVNAHNKNFKSDLMSDLLAQDKSNWRKALKAGPETESRAAHKRTWSREEEELSDLGLEDQMAELQKRFDAARRGIGLANRLQGADKKKHRSRVMSNLNTIRAQLNRVIKQFEQFSSAESDYQAGRGYEKQSHSTGSWLS